MMVIFEGSGMLELDAKLDVALEIRRGEKKGLT
jgi:hypothetical protein